MKFRFLIISLTLFSFVFGQEKNDSLLQFYSRKYNSNHYEVDFKKQIKSDSTLYKTLDSLKTIGYYTLTVDSVRENKVFLNKGRMYKRIWVKNDSIFNHNSDWFAVKNLDSLILSINKKYAQKGFPFTQIDIKPLGYRDAEAQIEVILKLFPVRTVDGVHVEGYEKLSKGYIRHGLAIKKGMIYNESELEKISERMSFNPMIRENRAPQTLFNTDSTTIFLYVEKEKLNQFDGILGFGNDINGNFQVNGNLKVELNNNFNGMEKIGLNWIATPDKSTSLDLNVRVPYLFRSAVGSETGLNIYRKDSIFVNTQFEERLFYQLNMNSNIGLNFGYENSNFVMEDHPALAALYDDYKKTGIGISYVYSKPTANRLMEGITGVYMISRTLNRSHLEHLPETDEWNKIRNSQYEVGLKAFHLFAFNPRNYLKAGVEGYGLFGNDELLTQNELYRIGGFGSIRGFNEESITASSYGIFSLEYRFMPNEGFYLSAFGDYAFLENKPAEISENLLGLGAGMSFLTQLGIFNISYAVGKQSDTGFDFKNSKIHFGILTRF